MGDLAVIWKLKRRMVERVKFTIKLLKSLEVPEGKSEVTIYDSEQPGLLARKQFSDSCTFELRRKVQGRAVRVRLGSFPALRIEQARKLARKELDIIGKGKNPNAKKRADRARNTTLSQCLEDYLSSRTLKNTSLLPSSGR